MIFSRSSNLHSSHSQEQIRSKLLGQTLDIHSLQFEILEKGDTLKIIPRTENEEKFRILPITHINLKNQGGKTVIAMKSKPRRIDIGGPNLLLVFCGFLFLCGGYLYVFQKEEMLMPAMIMVGLAVLIVLMLWISLERGYFDYFRKQKAYVKSIISQ